MVWSGIVVLLVGAVLALAVDADPGGLDLTAVGALLMVLGAGLLIAGILRLNRARRRVKVPAGGGPGRLEREGYRTGTKKTAAMIAAVVYILSPIDIIPDVFLPVGVIDDATALTWLLVALGQEFARHSRSRRRPR